MSGYDEVVNFPKRLAKTASRTILTALENMRVVGGREQGYEKNHLPPADGSPYSVRLENNRKNRNYVTACQTSSTVEYRLQHFREERSLTLTLKKTILCN